MAVADTFMLKTENYEEQMRSHWPPKGQHILAQYNEKSIIVYQAFCPEIADYAVQNGKFGGPKYSFTRMTWIKTNFLWMMYRSNWAQKKNQQRILAIYLTREGFDQILKFSKGTGIRVEGRTPGNVRIQWDPDHDPKGENQRRRAVQLGIKGIPLQRFHEQYIQHIEDITDFVKLQRQHVIKNELDKLVTPVERVYRPSEEDICRHILLDAFQCSKKDPVKNQLARVDTVSLDTVPANNKDKKDEEAGDVSGEADGAYCEELMHVAKTKPVRKGNKKDLIVCLGGSFNPVHSRHIQLVETAIRWLEENSNYHVVAARLAVAPDSYVLKKCKRKDEMCIKAEHRIKLCELACKGHNLIKTHYSTTFSARNCGENVKKWENWHNAKVAVIIGADKAVFSNGHWRWNEKSKCLTVCVGRKDKTDIVRKAYFEEYKADLTSNPDFLMIEDELEDVSSTEIRRQLCESEHDVTSTNSSTCKMNTGKFDNMNKIKEIYSVNELVNRTTDATDRTVPISWEEIIDDEMQSLKEDETENKAMSIKDQVNLQNSDTIRLKRDERQNVQTAPLESVALKLEYDLDDENRAVCKNSDLKKEHNGARPKTSVNVSGSNTTETATIRNKDFDSSSGLSTRRLVVQGLVSKGWLAESVGEYIMGKFSDLYLKNQFV